MGPVFGGESFGRSCDERELCSWKMNIENVNFVYKLICGGLFVRRADYLKTFKVRHKGAEDASLMVGLGPWGLRWPLHYCASTEQHPHLHFFLIILFPEIAIPSLDLSDRFIAMVYTVL